MAVIETRQKAGDKPSAKSKITFSIADGMNLGFGIGIGLTVFCILTLFALTIFGVDNPMSDKMRAQVAPRSQFR